LRLNRDGYLDLVTKFPTHELGLALGDTDLYLPGSMSDGQTFEGCDVIDTVPRRKGEKHSASHSRR
jgi:hypothetical protein